jgi:hypothetical protein
MRGERQLLRLGEYLLRRACRRLPPDIRQERYQEWAAELPAILTDPQVRPAPRRAVRMLAYAADTVRGTAMTPARARRRTSRMTALLYLLLVAGLVVVAGEIWAIVQAPGQGLHYAQLAWGLFLVAFPVSILARGAALLTVRIAISGILAGMAVSLWHAAQDPGDWVNYLVAAYQFLLLGWWLVGRRARARRHKAAHSA